jgi:hypothetical protein
MSVEELEHLQRILPMIIAARYVKEKEDKK